MVSDCLCIVVTTFVLNLVGYKLSNPEWRWDEYIYQTLRLFSLRDSAEVEGPISTEREKLWGDKGERLHPIAALFASVFASITWWFTVGSVIVSVMSQPALFALVRCLGRRHVIQCGLDDRRSRLVTKLRAQGRDMVVLEPNKDHPELESCRVSGAVCLVASAEDIDSLEAAGLRYAAELLFLGEDDRANMNTLATAAQLLAEPITLWDRISLLRPFSQLPSEVKCLVEVNEPGLLDIVRRHPLQTNRKDRLDLRVFSAHEMAARAMLRETMIEGDLPNVRKMLVVGIGKLGRLAEALIIRAIKDHHLEHRHDALEIHVLDENADEWTRYITERAAFLNLRDDQLIVPIQCSAVRCGFMPTDTWKGVVGESYDAIFVCIADESLAIMQAGRIADLLSNRGASTQIIVRVQEENAGFGPVFATGPDKHAAQKSDELHEQQNASKRFDNIHLVGVQDRVFEIVSSMNPEVEMLAQVLHQDYLSLTKELIRLGKESEDRLRARAYRAWTELPEEYKEASRALARRLHHLLQVKDKRGHVVREYKMQHAPLERIDPHETFRPNKDEIELLSQSEHDAFVAESSRAQGWQNRVVQYFWRGRGGNNHKNMVPWNELEDHVKTYDRTIVRRLSITLAKADYKIVPKH